VYVCEDTDVCMCARTLILCVCVHACVKRMVVRFEVLTYSHCEDSCLLGCDAV